MFGKVSGLSLKNGEDVAIFCPKCPKMCRECHVELAKRWDGAQGTRCVAGYVWRFLAVVHLRGRWTPLGPVYIYASSVRGRASLTRGYRVVRPQWGRRPRGVVLGCGGCSAAREFACVETRFIASHPLGAQPRRGILPSHRAIRAVRRGVGDVSARLTASKRSGFD